MGLPALEIHGLCWCAVNVSGASEVNLGLSISIIAKLIFGEIVSLTSLLFPIKVMLLWEGKGGIWSQNWSTFPNAVSATRHR